MSLTVRFLCASTMVLDGFRFLFRFGGWLGLERIVLRPFGVKCTPLEPAPHNHVGPTGQTNIVKHESLGNHFMMLYRLS